MKTLVVLSLLVAAVVAVPVQEQKVRFDNYKVFRFIPKDEAEVETLSTLETVFPGINYWQRPSKPGRAVDVMVPPHLQAEIVNGLRSTTVNVVEPYIADVQKLIDEEEAASIKGAAKTLALGWDAYYGYDDILAFLDEQAAKHPEATVETFGTTFEGRPLKVIKISTGGNGQRPVIFLDANIHAREWITNAVATYIINELLNGEANGARSLLNTFDVHVVPVLNPDGYEYSRETNRMWRKTRSDYGGALCRGADPNRNFGFQWNTGGSSSLCSSDTYMGVRAFSEPETKAVADYLATIQNKTISYLSLHSYSQLNLIPFGTRINGSPRIPDHSEHMRIGELMAAGFRRRYGTEFETGNIVEILYVASGASVDYAKGAQNTDTVFTFELRDTGRYGFLLPPEQIRPSALEFIDGLLVLGEELKKKL